MPGVPDDPWKRAKGCERHRHPKLTKAPRLLPDDPADHTDRDRDDLRCLPERESQDEPEQTHTGAIGPFYKAERKEEYQSAVDDIAAVETLLVNELIENKRRPDPEDSCCNERGRFSNRPPPDPPDEERCDGTERNWNHSQRKPTT